MLDVASLRLEPVRPGSPRGLAAAWGPRPSRPLLTAVSTAARAALVLMLLALVSSSPLPAAAYATADQAAQAALRTAGEFLVVNDGLEPAAAMVILDGGSPERETEAAALYRAGWAPRLVLVPGAPHADAASGEPEWAPRYALLRRLGVPPTAITIADGQASRTLDELEHAYASINPTAGPVILVTSKSHARRVSVIWQVVSGGASRGIVRVPAEDHFDAATWWQDPRSAQSALHELVGLVALPGQGTQATLQARLGTLQALGLV